MTPTMEKTKSSYSKRPRTSNSVSTRGKVSRKSSAYRSPAGARPVFEGAVDRKVSAKRIPIAVPKDGRVRLNKFIADCGITSRRKADFLIDQGVVVVNGRKVFEHGVRVDPVKDTVEVDGVPVSQVKEELYFMFHKPKSVVTTLDDPEGRPCLKDYLKDFPYRLYPVGRLDWDTEGLLILTNNGNFANMVMHPRNEITKSYLVKVDGHLEERDIQKLLAGVTIVGGFVKARSVIRLRRGADQYGWYRIVIDEGKNRQVHKMFEKIGFDVQKLQRVAIGQLEIGSLERGKNRLISKRELENIFLPDNGLSQAQSLRSTSKFSKRSSERRKPLTRMTRDSDY